MTARKPKPTIGQFICTRCDREFSTYTGLAVHQNAARRHGRLCKDACPVAPTGPTLRTRSAIAAKAVVDLCVKDRTETEVASYIADAIENGSLLFGRRVLDAAGYASPSIIESIVAVAAKR